MTRATTPGTSHSMPYMWWTTGFAYDTKKIDEDLTSWAALWDPRYDNHIMMLDDQREVFAAALIRRARASIRSTTPSSTPPSPCSRSSGRSCASTAETPSAT